MRCASPCRTRSFRRASTFIRPRTSADLPAWARRFSRTARGCGSGATTTSASCRATRPGLWRAHCRSTGCSWPTAATSSSAPPSVSRTRSPPPRSARSRPPTSRWSTAAVATPGATTSASARRSRTDLQLDGQSLVGHARDRHAGQLEDGVLARALNGDVERLVIAAAEGDVRELAAAGDAADRRQVRPGGPWVAAEAHDVDVFLVHADDVEIPGAVDGHAVGRVVVEVARVDVGGGRSDRAVCVDRVRVDAAAVADVEGLLIERERDPVRVAQVADELGGR